MARRKTCPGHRDYSSQSNDIKFFRRSTAQAYETNALRRPGERGACLCDPLLRIRSASAEANLRLGVVAPPPRCNSSKPLTPALDPQISARSRKRFRAIYQELRRSIYWEVHR